MPNNKIKDAKRPKGMFYSEELLNMSGGNVFRLVRIAAVRALELESGRPMLIENAYSDKVTTIALEEIAQGKIHFVNKETSRQKGEGNQS